ncbi:DUF3592 domain-containing protein [Tengunoibacter tsumagoiensis]|uniref:DUF3592 domain-containing protein n=1 Tax=Tengunoibacter tsumagoiensis TaxID=2014871 RepID=A0A401ZWN6_9CHLR|nr:DUF3592 domain-containing protein [Tengunoibacter tsumagoiensis]GCE11283.1 hypothetical protein KTT_11420 [Tengunoibacter tsumagoiensis]
MREWKLLRFILIMVGIAVLIILVDISFFGSQFWTLNTINHYTEGTCVITKVDQLLQTADHGAPVVNLHVHYTVQAAKAYEATRFAWESEDIHTTARQPDTGLLQQYNVVIGQQRKCWYDPADPTQALLDRSYNFSGNLLSYTSIMLVPTIIAIFVLILFLAIWFQMLKNSFQRDWAP